MCGGHCGVGGCVGGGGVGMKLLRLCVSLCACCTWKTAHMCLFGGLCLRDGVAVCDVCAIMRFCKGPSVRMRDCVCVCVCVRLVRFLLIRFGLVWLGLVRRVLSGLAPSGLGLSGGSGRVSCGCVCVRVRARVCACVCVGV